jgi:hypothetical protein
MRRWFYARTGVFCLKSYSSLVRYAPVALLLVACPHATVDRVAITATPGALVDLTLPSLEGGEMAFAQFRGKIVVVHFIVASSLAAQMDLEQERKVRGPGVELVEIALDVAGYELVGPWARGAGVDWPVLLASDEIRAGTSVFGDVHYTPTTMVLDREGRIVWGHVGGLPRGALAQVIKSL